MSDKIIPFEIHITVEIFSLSQQNDFVLFCKLNEAKPLLIELSRGEFVSQPMLSKIIESNDFAIILSAANQLSQLLTTNHFIVRRLKIEVPADEAALFSDFSTSFEKYFEWHGKVSYTAIEKLEEICEAHQVHLSRNALKNENEFRFITLREYGTKATFEDRIKQLSISLKKENRIIYKPQSEYCIFDNHQYLDNGWLLK
ncbi:hypothetical protein [Emticicia sp. C21]|uniref:hypothetical protein n=1 Tax=Emticicia sp. C21 TaxID=2302915 RepID=UPI000E343506|nr:hypothetical protein [Emticicia sp. C21]RFS17858.1 hypothetical protein D0T08_01015 [Emticicia sp. C21]